MIEKLKAEPRELELLGATIEPIELAADNQSGELTCDMNFYTGAAVTRMDFWTGEKYMLAFSMEPGACDLSRLNGGAPFLNNHNSDSLSDVIGVIQPGSARIENGVGKATVRFSNRPELAGLRADIQNKIISKVSMGVAINTLKNVTPKDSKMKSFLATSWQPQEISAVPVPADAGAGFLSHQNVEPQIEGLATAKSKETNMDEKEVARLAEVARLKAIEDNNEVIRLAAVTAERLRVSTIEAACKPFAALTAEFRSELIASGGTVDAARAAILTKMAELSAVDPTRQATASVTVDQGTTVRLAAENALLNRWNPDAYKLEAGRQFHGMSLLEMAKDFIALKGVSVKGMDRSRVVELAFQGTTDFPSVLANVFNKSLRSGYNAEPQTFKPFTRRGTITDFKPVNRTQIGDVPTLQQLGPSGEYHYAKVTDAKETYSLATYGQIFAINRQVLINDDLGAFTRIPESQGRAAARMESDVVWGIITANANMADGVALFATAATRANYTSSGTVISIASLGVGRQKMRVQTGLAGVGYLNLAPKYLIVPTALETVAQQFTVQTNIIVTQQSNINPIGPTLMVIPEPRLDANSATAWYLSADAGQIDTVEYSYLEGQEGVYMETRMGFDVDGMELKVREDFAAKALDFRGLYKNAGA